MLLTLGDSLMMGFYDNYAILVTLSLFALGILENISGNEERLSVITFFSDTAV